MKKPLGKYQTHRMGHESTFYGIRFTILRMARRVALQVLVKSLDDYQWINIRREDLVGTPDERHELLRMAMSPQDRVKVSNLIVSIASALESWRPVECSLKGMTFAVDGRKFSINVKRLPHDYEQWPPPVEPGRSIDEFSEKPVLIEDPFDVVEFCLCSLRQMPNRPEINDITIDGDHKSAEAIFAVDENYFCISVRDTD